MASTLADKPLSVLPDAERVKRSGVQSFAARDPLPLCRTTPMTRPLRRRPTLAIVATVVAIAGCQPASGALPDPARQKAIGDTLTALIRSAYDLKAKDVVGRLMSLYPDSGRVISASGGRVTTTRDSLEAGIKSFYDYVGRNMQDPTWIWGRPQIDVLSPDAAVVTTTYRVPHRTPTGAPHTIAGAWTAVFARRAGRWVIVQEHLSEIPSEVMDADTADVPAAHTHD